MNLPFVSRHEIDPSIKRHEELINALGGVIELAREHNDALSEERLTEELIAGSTNVIDARSEFGGPNFEHRASGNNAPSAS